MANYDCYEHLSLPKDTVSSLTGCKTWVSVAQVGHAETDFRCGVIPSASTNRPLRKVTTPHVVRYRNTHHSIVRDSACDKMNNLSAGPEIASIQLPSLPTGPVAFAFLRRAVSGGTGRRTRVFRCQIVGLRSGAVEQRAE